MSASSSHGNAAFAPQPARLPLRVRRSAVACRTCRRRKIRCDVTVSGHPCTNCRLDDDHCVVVGPKRPQRVRATERRREPAQPAPSTTAATALQNSLASSLLAPSLSVFDYPPDSGQSFYPPVLSADMSWLPPHEVAYLNSQQSLTLPKKAIIHTLLRYYFLHVYPLFPVVRESEFRESTIYGKPFSLLVFRSMLFAATHHTPVECAQDAGYTSIAHLRFSLYRSAKFSPEKDPFNISQAALLLSDHFDYADPLGNTTWLAIAIQHARRANAHRRQALQLQDIQKYRISDLKRLWWCCLLRDRVLGVASRRPLVITLDQFDPASADYLDISEVWDDDCEFFDAPMRVVLYRVLISHCRLATWLTPRVMSADHAPGLLASNLCVEAEKALVMDAIWRLSSWDGEYEELLKDKEVITNLAVAVNVHFTSILYIGARLAILNRLVVLYLSRCRCSYEINEAAGRELYLTRFVDLISKLNEEVKWFTINRVLYFLPVSIRPIALMPHTLIVLAASQHNNDEDNTQANDEAHAVKRYLDDAISYYSAVDADYGVRFGLSTYTETLPQMVKGISSHHAPPDKPQNCLRLQSTPTGTKLDIGGCTPVNKIYFSKICIHLSTVLDYGFSTGTANHITPDIVSSLYQRIAHRSPQINECSGTVNATSYPSFFRSSMAPRDADADAAAAAAASPSASASGSAHSSGDTPSSSSEPHSYGYGALSPPPQISLPMQNPYPAAPSAGTPSSWHKEDQDDGATSLERFDAVTSSSQQTMQEWASELEEFMGPLFGL